MRCEVCDEQRQECLCTRSSIWHWLALRPMWQQWLIIIAGYMAIFSVLMFACSAQAQVFTVEPPAGTSPVRVTLVWDIPGAASCEASGSWTGTKAAKGTLVTTINAAATYTLTCVKPGTGGTATLSWLPPTTNTDGTPLSDGAGYTIVHGLTPTTMDKVVDVPGIATSRFTVTDLPAGERWFGLASYNSAGTRSTRVVVSKIVTVTPGAQNFAATVRVDVTQQPSPPTDVRIVFAPGEEPPPEPAVVTRINLGSGAITDSAGNAWASDTCRGGSTSNMRGVDILGTEDDVLYRSVRYAPLAAGPIKCSIPVSGTRTCEIEMRTSEEFFVTGGPLGKGAGLRVFEMWAEGVLLIPDIDIYREVGEHTALVKRASVTVSDGTLDVEFRHKVENPTVAGLAVTCQ